MPTIDKCRERALLKLMIFLSAEMNTKTIIHQIQLKIVLRKKKIINKLNETASSKKKKLHIIKK